MRVPSFDTTASAAGDIIGVPTPSEALVKARQRAALPALSTRRIELPKIDGHGGPCLAAFLDAIFRSTRAARELDAWIEYAGLSRMYAGIHNG